MNCLFISLINLQARKVVSVRAMKSYKIIRSVASLFLSSLYGDE